MEKDIKIGLQKYEGSTEERLKNGFTGGEGGNGERVKLWLIER